MRHWRTTGNSNVANQTGSTYISDSIPDITPIPTANLGFSTTPAQRNCPQTIAITTDNRKWQYGHSNRKYLYVWNYGRQDDSSNGKLWVYGHPSSQKLTLGDCDSDR